METTSFLWVIAIICYSGFGLNVAMKIEVSLPGLWKKNFWVRIINFIFWPISGMTFFVIGFDSPE